MPKIAFFDFAGTLFRPTNQGWKIFPGASTFLTTVVGANHRIGLLCNIPPGHTEESIRLLLRAHGLEAWIDPDLFILVSQLPCRLPQAAAFRVAAAMANAEPKDLLFVSADDASRKEAAKADWSVIAPPPDQASPIATLLGDTGEAVSASLLAVVNEDRSPTFILKGRVVTLNSASEVIAQGRILVRDGKIANILKPVDALPPEFKAAPVVDTKGTIYPGLIDLHNHLAYDILTLWNVPQKFTNRAQWQKHKDYSPNISAPGRVIAGNEPTAKAAARYIEVKAIAGGCTTSQGMMMIEKKIVKYFKGLTRNVENTGDTRLPKAATSVLDLNVKDVDNVATFRRNLQNGTSFFYHLSEGTDAAARDRFLDLQNNNLLASPLVGIHSLALQLNDLKALKAAGAKMIWSPFSNLLLYGNTVNLKNVVASGLRVALGCDWSPSGSKNPLLELKIAKWCSDQAGKLLSDEQLVRMVTSTPAEILGWQKYLGTLVPSAMADIVVIAGDAKDPYLQLIEARERDVQLVTIHGTPRYGDNAFMKAIIPDAASMEIYDIDKVSRTFYFKHPESLINGITLKSAVATLQDAMADLPQFVKDTGQVKAGLFGAGLDPGDQFGLVLDMDAHDGADESGLEPATLLAQVDPNKIAKSVTLDPIAVADPKFLTLLDDQGNLPKGLKTTVRSYYA